MQGRPRWWRHLAAFAFVLGLTSVALALARPVAPVNTPVNRTTIMLAVDVSGSMNATDVTPSRMRALQEAADGFVENVPSDINVGLVSFNNQASLVVPPTQDHFSVADGIDSLTPSGSTAIGDAIFVCLDAIKRVPPAPDGSPVPARIVLMSDGATNTGRSNDSAVAAAKAAGVPVWTIAYGTDSGTVTIPGPNGGTFNVPVDAAALAAIASQTGGQTFTADSADRIRQVYADIGRSLGYHIVDSDLSGLFAAIGFALLAVGGAIGLVWGNRLP